MDSTVLDSSMPQQSLNVGQQEISYLKEAATWGKFLAIVGFIMCGLLAVFSFFAASIFTDLSSLQATSIPQGMGAMLTAIYLAIAILYFFPCYYLYSFATRMKRALVGGDQTSFGGSFSSLKSLLKFMGILTIIVFGIYIIVIIAVMFGAMAFKS